MDQQEVYIPIRDFPNYVISNLGHVKNLKTGKTPKQTLVKSTGYYYISLRNLNGFSLLTVHRLMASHFIPNPENLPQVDHINRIRTDNRIGNLRWVSCQENSFNAKKTSRVTSSSHKGVSWNKGQEKWRAYIRMNGKLLNLGVYENEIDAARAYNEKATELFGEHANLNAIPDN